MSAWWRRNRLWLLLLVPLLALACAASSFRYLNLYLPWEWSRPIVAQGSSGTLVQEITSFADSRPTRTVTVRVVDAAPVDELAVSDYETVRAATGGVLWRVDLAFEAAPDQLLATPCTIELRDAAGIRYGVRGGKVDAVRDAPFRPTPTVCVPRDAQGPKQGIFAETIEQDGPPRPRTWRTVESIVLPVGVTPTEVTIGWEQPVYLVLPLP